MGKGVGMPFIVSADGLGDDRFVICLCLRVLTEYVSVFSSLSFKYGSIQLLLAERLAALRNGDIGTVDLRV